MCVCANLKCAYFVPFSFGFGVTCLFRLFKFCMSVPCGRYVNVSFFFNKITDFPLSFLVVLIDSFWDF